MADEPLRSTSPVANTSGFAGHQPAQVVAASRSPAANDRPATDSVALHRAATVARDLLRERVLAHTRKGLQLGDGEAPPEFAEVRHNEPAPLFLGRLLSAQNQLAARRALTWPAPRVRACLDEALRAGVAEVLEMLALLALAEAEAVWFVRDVLAEYERRLAGL
ncbi:MAG: hypothetical protein IT455_01005 [Planctomycetes bacterium]|nr:hypothetical protein [Planctomycetota bacterium]